MNDIKKMKPVALNDEDLSNVSGGTYIPGVHSKIDENVMPDGIIEILYEGTDWCPVCNRVLTSVFYQQRMPGNCNVAFMCADCINKYCN